MIKLAAVLALAGAPPSIDYKGFTKQDTSGGAFTLSDGNMTVMVEPMADGKYQASFRGAKSSPHLQSAQGAVDWAACYRDEAKRLAASVNSVQTTTPSTRCP